MEFVLEDRFGNPHVHRNVPRFFSLCVLTRVLHAPLAPASDSQVFVIAR